MGMNIKETQHWGSSMSIAVLLFIIAASCGTFCRAIPDPYEGCFMLPQLSRFGKEWPCMDWRHYTGLREDWLQVLLGELLGNHDPAVVEEKVLAAVGKYGYEKGKAVWVGDVLMCEPVDGTDTREPMDAIGVYQEYDRAPSFFLQSLPPFPNIDQKILQAGRSTKRQVKMAVTLPAVTDEKDNTLASQMAVLEVHDALNMIRARYFFSFLDSRSCSDYFTTRMQEVEEQTLNDSISSDEGTKQMREDEIAKLDSEISGIQDSLETLKGEYLKKWVKLMKQLKSNQVIEKQLCTLMNTEYLWTAESQDAILNKYCKKSPSESLVGDLKTFPYPDYIDAINRK
eukprot:Nk52_evm37s745 gene=Nk52_evmTU37s745